MSRMRILTSAGIEDVELRTDEARSVVGSYWNAVRRYLWTGETEDLDRFARTLIRDRRLLTDPDRIDRLARIGELDFEDIYES
jgi:hypothetical protein